MEEGVITDHVNNLQAIIRYNPWGDNSYKSMIKKSTIGKMGAKMFGFGKKKDEEKA